MKKRFLIAVLTTVFTLSIASFAFAATTTTTNGIVGSIVTNDTANDNGLDNANKTGVGVGTNDGTTADAVIRSGLKPDGEQSRTHGEYQSNTNACASCHQTHTAAAKNLLFKDSTYTTCTACHDGTLGFYNVFTSSTAGTFGGTEAGNASMHLPNGAMKISAAPGGNLNNTAVTGANGVSNTWTADFTCASCHAPHGSYSDRLLSYNPNGIGNTNMYFQKTDGTFIDKTGAVTTTPVKTGGLKIVGATVVTSLPTTASILTDNIVYRTTSDSATLGTAKVTQEPNDTPVIVLMKKSGTTWVRDLTPWLTDKPALLGANTRFTAIDGATKIVNIEAKYAQAYAKAVTTATVPVLGDITTVVKADIARVVVVKFDMTAGNVKDFNGLPIKQVDVSSYDNAGYGTQITQFCAACHTDYQAKSGTATGVWSTAFRHSTTSDNYTCLKCHFAHGTDVNVMLDADDQSVKSLVAGGETLANAQAYMIDKNPSSALKRYTNMSVCWKCHTESKSSSFINNVFVQGAVDPSKASTEFNTPGTNLPEGWKEVPEANIPYGVAPYSGPIVP